MNSPDRRSSPRSPARPGLWCRLSAAEEPSPVPALVPELSARGCALLVREWVEPGRAARLEFAGGPRGPFGARVAGAVADRGGYRVGVEFDSPLPDAELRALLRGD